LLTLFIYALHGSLTLGALVKGSCWYWGRRDCCWTAK